MSIRTFVDRHPAHLPTLEAVNELIDRVVGLAIIAVAATLVAIGGLFLLSVLAGIAVAVFRWLTL